MSTRSFSGASAATGVMTLINASVGFFVDAGVPHAFTSGMPIKTLDATLPTGAAVTIEGTVGDPNDPTSWYEIASVSASGVTRWNGEDVFTRVNVGTLPSGSVTARLSVSDA